MKKFGILVNGDYSKIKFRKKLAETVKLVKKSFVYVDENKTEDFTMAENKQYITHAQENGSVMISEDVIATIVANAVSEVEGIVFS